jgi:hypothetical protein
VKSQGADGNIYANLVAVEAVGNRLGRGVDPYRHPFDEVRFDAFGQSGAGEADDSELGIIELGAPRLFRQGYPDLPRKLRGEIVEPKRREQTDHRVGHSLGNKHQPMILGERMIGGHVKSPPLPFQKALVRESIEMGPGDPVGLQIPGADDAESADEREKSPFRGCDGHRPNDT